MYNIKTKINKGLFLLGFFGLLVAPLTLPVNVASAAACDSRTLTGTVETGTPPTRARFEYGTNSNTVSNGGGIPTTVQTFNQEGTFPMQQFISGLTENTTYYYRIAVTNNFGTSNGEVRTFTTASCEGTQNPTVNITANPTNVSYNGSSTISWNSNNATSCTATGGSNGWSGNRNLSGTFNTGSLTSTTTYTIRCSNSTGSATDSVTVSVNNITQNPTVNISADDTSVSDGDSTTVRWNSNNADYCTGSGGQNGWSGSRNTSGSFNTGSLNSNNITFTITCYNQSGQASDSVRISTSGDNQDRPRVDIRADDTSVSSGDSTTIRWDSDNADTCRGTDGRNGWSGRRNLDGSFYTGSLTSTTTYRITCENSRGSSDDSVTVRVNDNNDNICRDSGAVNYLGNLPCRYNQIIRPTVSISADQTSVAFNGATTIRWNTTNATSCDGSGGSFGWAGLKSIGPASFYTGSLTATRTYSITCSNSVGSATDSVTVNVRGQVLGTTTTRTPNSLVLVSSSVDRNRPIVPTLDNTNPCPGDEINYTVTYQNIGNASISNLVLRVDLPIQVDYIFSTPTNPTQSGNTLIFNLGSLGANKSGTVTIRMRVRDDVSAGESLNLPAVLSYIDPSGNPQSVNSNVSASICNFVSANTNENVSLGAGVFGAGFLPTNIVGWLLLIILILILVLLARYAFGQSAQRRMVTTYNPNNGQSTTTTL